ncbi:MAG: alpha/beta hydrolase [Acidobacteria bacterium]|nr:alpha/beta hydrolase [Acidobacteriota bacterium]
MSAVEEEGGFRADDISPRKAVAARSFPVYLICGERDRNIPARHSKRIYQLASGAKELWIVPEAGHSAALGTAPEEFEQRVISYFGGIHAENAPRQSH